VAVTSRRLLHWNLLRFSTALGVMSPARVINQNVAHSRAVTAKKVRAILPFDLC